MLPTTEATFVNLVRITEIKDVDYIVHLFNSYTGKTWIFKIYKNLWNKAMEIRTIQDLEITVGDPEKEKKKERRKREKREEKIAGIFM